MKFTRKTYERAFDRYMGAAQLAWLDFIEDPTDAAAHYAYNILLRDAQLVSQRFVREFGVSG